MQDLLAGLGHPERSQRFVHVAGTNGKGSTSAMIAAAFRESPLRVGLYTSPHLIEPTERINIQGSPVGTPQFADAFSMVHQVAEEMLLARTLDAHPSYFETVTAMALLLFKESCDISVIEVGLGGRLDATNVIQPELCVITPVAYDHEAYLGNTLELISSEKAGILKAGVPAVISYQNPVARAVIQKRAHELHCPLIQTEDFALANLEASQHGSNFELQGEVYEIPLPGRHQVENAKAAILACSHLGLSPQTIRAGIKKVKWPGRLELVSRNPDFILDGAHNPAGAAALASYIREFYSHRPVWLVYGAMRDKAVEEVAELLFPLASKLIATAPDFPRALRPEAILELSPHHTAVTAPSVGAAIEMARLAPSNAVVFFTGSLFLVGEARAILAPPIS